MDNLTFIKEKEKPLSFYRELMSMLNKVPQFSDKDLRPQAGFMPSFKIGYREYNIVNKTDHVIIRPKYWYHSDGSYTVSPAPTKTFYNVQNALDYLTSY